MAAISSYTPITPIEGLDDGDFFLGNKGSGASATRRLPPSAVYDRRFGRLLERYGAVFNGTSNDQPAIQNALNAMSTGFCNGPKALCTFPPGVTARILDPGLTIDMSRIAVNFNYSLLDASGMTTGRAIGVTGTQASFGPYGQLCGGLANLHLWGHVQPVTTPHPTLVGIVMDSTVPSAGTRALFESLYIRGFGGGGIVLDKRCNFNHFFNCEIAHCGIGLWQKNGVDSGASINFEGGAIYNCTDYAVKSENQVGEINFHNSSLYYNGGFIHINAGATLFITDCSLQTHWSLATSDANLCPIYVDGSGAACVIKGGRLAFTGSNPSAYHMIHCGITSSQCSVIAENVWMNNWGNTFNRLAKGQGRVQLRNTLFWDGAHSNMPHIIGGGGMFQGAALNDKMSDWSFEGVPVSTPAINIWDQVFIYDDGGMMPSTLWAGVNGDVGISNAFASHGTKSLELRKKTAAGNSFKVCIVTPAKRRAAWGMECKVRGDGSVSGVYGMGFGSSIFRPTAVGGWYRYPLDVDFPSLDPDISFITRRPNTIGPQWADFETHSYMLFDLTNLGPGSLYVDEVLMSEW